MNAGRIVVTPYGSTEHGQGVAVRSPGYASDLQHATDHMAEAVAIVLREYAGLAADLERVRQRARRLAELPIGLGPEGPRNEARLHAEQLPGRIATLRAMLERLP